MLELDLELKELYILLSRNKIISSSFLGLPIALRVIWILMSTPHNVFGQLAVCLEERTHNYLISLVSISLSREVLREVPK